MKFPPLAHVTPGLPATPELQHDLQKIRYLLTVLTSLPVDDAHDLEDVVWLNNRHRFLRSVIASRSQLRQQKIVDLGHWRQGGLAPTRSAPMGPAV